MVENSVDTGGAGRLTIRVTQIGAEPWNNRSLCRATLIFSERTSSPSTWVGGGIPASMTTPSTALWTGSFGFDWRPAGLQSQEINTTDFWVGHNAEGYGSTIVAGSIGDTGTAGGGGPATVDVFLDLGRFVNAPGTPTGVTATRISDTQVKLDWTNNEASNGQATQIAVRRRINDGAWEQFTTFGRTNTVTVAAQVNQKIEYQIMASNSGGSSAWSTSSNAVYTTPGPATNLVAVKDAGGNIDLTFQPTVAYAEHTHEVWHGTVSGGVVTWDGAALATLAAGVSTYEHPTPSTAQQHRYRVRAKAGALASAWTESNTVVLLTAPGKPTIPALAPFANRAGVFRFPWVHNSVDSSAQTKYQWRWSNNGGSTWTTGAKTTSANQYHDFAANTWAANATITFQVRTKGAYDSGSDGDASYSPWSDSVSVTFKSLPVTTITTPANGGTLNDATVRVTVGFAQAEGASFVRTQLELLSGGIVLETKESAISVGITLDTQAQNGTTYTVRARSQDSNGLWSAWVSSTFGVTYLPPVPALTEVTYLPEKGFGQIDLSINAPRVNLYTNSSFENTGAPVTYRTNFYRNPLNQGPTAGLAFGSNPYTNGSPAPAGSYDVISSWQIVEATSLPAGGRFGYRVTVPLTGAASGTPVAFRMSATGLLLPTGVRARFWVDVVSTDGSTIVGHYDDFFSASQLVVAGSVTPTANAGSAMVYVWLESTTAWTGNARFSTAWGTVEVGVPAAGWPFTGDTQMPGSGLDTDLTTAWLGQMANSASVLTAPSVVDATAPGVNMTAFSSTKWFEHGVRSLRVIPLTTSLDTYASIGGDTGAMRLGMEAGKTYTALAKIRLNAPQASPSTQTARRIRAFYYASGSYLSFDSTPAPNVAGVHELRLTFTVPSNATQAFIRLQNGASRGNGEVWFDDFVLVEGTYTGPWFEPEGPASTVSISRLIDGVEEVLVTDYPASADLTFLDTTPVIHGTNTYRITTKSALGAQTTVVKELVTKECRRAFLSKGAGFDVVGVFGANLKASESLEVASDTVEAAGRIKPIGLYGTETSVQLKVSSLVYDGFGSTKDELRQLLLMPGKACYRDASGRRIFGTTKGGVSYRKSSQGEFSFTMKETS